MNNLLELNRRTALKTIGGGLLVGAMAGSANAGGDDLSHELNEVRAATRKYRNVGLARDDGYGELVSPYEPEMGFHFVNPDLIAADEDGPFKLTEPPILVYFTTGNYDPEPFEEHDSERDGDLRLGGVEFAHVGDRDVLDESSDPDEGTPADIFSDEEANRNLKVSEEEGWEWVPPAKVTAIHAWVHRGNPAGVFNPTNPTID